MSPIPDLVAEARQLLAACDWTIEEHHDTKLTYVVVDPRGVPRRCFVPPKRLLDYARGVFDSAEF